MVFICKKRSIKLQLEKKVPHVQILKPFAESMTKQQNKTNKKWFCRSHVFHRNQLNWNDE